MVKPKSKGRSTSSKSVLFLSDMHVGSSYAICSEAPVIGEIGSVHTPNKLQQTLFEKWLWVKDSLVQKPHIMVLNGEPCDGANTKQQGQQSWTPNINDQLIDAYKLLSIFDKNYFLMTRGSNYHVQVDATNYEEILARMMNCTPYSGLFDISRDIRTDYYLTFRLNGKVFNVTHHIGFNRWFAYRTTSIAREMADMEFMRGRYWKDEDMPQVIVRSHAHYFVYVRFSNQHGFITPAWKFPDAHLFKGGMGGTAPSIGAVEVIVEPNGKILVEPHIVNNTEYPKHCVLELSE